MPTLQEIEAGQTPCGQAQARVHSPFHQFFIWSQLTAHFQACLSNAMALGLESNPDNTAGKPGSWMHVTTLKQSYQMRQ